MRGRSTSADGGARGRSKSKTKSKTKIASDTKKIKSRGPHVWGINRRQMVFCAAIAAAACLWTLTQPAGLDVKAWRLAVVLTRIHGHYFWRHIGTATNRCYLSFVGCRQYLFAAVARESSLCSFWQRHNLADCFRFHFALCGFILHRSKNSILIF